jgi:GNAT superfamily N-acetyltransferase
VAAARLPTRVWYLEMREAGALRPGRAAGPDVSVTRAEVPLGALNRFFYEEVGRAHHWVDRLGWSAGEWQAYAERPELETWLVHERGTPAGYAELDARADASVEVASFGILAPLHGRRLGARLLTEVTARAWQLGAVRVTVDTCELDGDGALENYRARGFDLVREAVEDRGRSG